MTLKQHLSRKAARDVNERVGGQATAAQAPTRGSGAAVATGNALARGLRRTDCHSDSGTLPRFLFCFEWTMMHLLLALACCEVLAKTCVLAAELLQPRLHPPDLEFKHSKTVVCVQTQRGSDL